MRRDHYLQISEQSIPIYTETEQYTLVSSKLGVYEDEEESHVGGSRESKGRTVKGKTKRLARPDYSSTLQAVERSGGLFSIHFKVIRQTAFSRRET